MCVLVHYNSWEIFLEPFTYMYVLVHYNSCEIFLEPFTYMCVLVHYNSCEMFLEPFTYMYGVKFSRKKPRLLNLQNDNIRMYCAKLIDLIIMIKKVTKKMQLHRLIYYS
jgi:hypothetical protein